MFWYVQYSCVHIFYIQLEIIYSKYINNNENINI